MKERKKLFTDIPISTISGFLRENFSSREGRIFEMERLNFVGEGEETRGQEVTSRPRTVEIFGGK